MDPIATVNDPVGDLEELILLLDRASRKFALAALEVGDGSPRHWLSLSVLLVQAQAVELLPDAHVVADLDLVEERLDRTLAHISGVPAGEWGALQLLLAAEQFMRLKAFQRARWPGSSALVRQVCDLVREADHVDR